MRKLWLRAEILLVSITHMDVKAGVNVGPWDSVIRIIDLLPPPVEKFYKACN